MESGNKIFTLKIIRDLNRLVKQGKITSSKMVELMNEAVGEEIDYNGCGGNGYIKSIIKDLDKEDE